ncbi:nucleoside deaminase [Paramicrobacterium agarici]|uniref:Guanine deaminase n=1 Tax=Paramicrobacterium agarici TaxID=630514 RepID=A0A2A9DRZ3_9MICO|nr:nucleoside deaminase [Microbacterium agarici]PFG29161.1 guanine deaminase [Microbacterium agarici]TQO22125.1 guanine deaminase [Microbacterium agarici]
MTVQTTTRADEKYLARAIDIATENVRTQGGPFGALVVTADGQEFEGVNRVTANLDPTAHAEVSAIRAACTGTGTFDLSGAVLYTSCEPCPMCLASALWARLDRIVFAANRDDAAAAGFDDATFYRFFDDPSVRQGMLPVSVIALEDAIRTAPFIEWGNTTSRIEY